jgi:hypothetical protein
MAVAQRDRLEPAEREAVDRFLSLMQTDGASESVTVDPAFLLQDGNADLFFLHYFPRDFIQWEPINTQMLEMVEGERRAVGWLPGGHGKSTTLRRWLIYVMCREPQIAMIYVEKNDTTAGQVARSLMTLLESHEGLIHDFGKFKSNDTQWSTNAIVIAQRPFVAEFPTLAFYGAGGSAVLGKRANICVVDDPVTSDNSNSELERARLLQWYNDQPATTIISPPPIKNMHYFSKLFLVGTTFHMDDLFHTVLGKGGYKHLWLKAVEEDGSCLAPSRFCYRDPEELKRSAEDNPADAVLLQRVADGVVVNLMEWRKHHGTASFLKRFQNNIIDPDTQRFPRLWFDGGTDEMAPPGGYPGCFGIELSLGEPRQEGWTYVTGVDPAAGTQGPKTVRFACVTLGCNLKEDQNAIRLVDLDFGQQPMVSDNDKRDSQVDIVLDHAARYGSRVVLESNNVQGVWAQAIKQEARRRGQIVNITGHFTDKTKKADEEYGIEAMAPMVENGYFQLPYKEGEPTTRRKVESLVEEFVFKGVIGTDDILMATWFAWRVIERSKRASIHKRVDTICVPPYRNVGAKWDFPPSWTDEQKAAFLGLIPEEEADEQVC